MATKKTSILEKINQTELRIKELVKQRNKELLDIITRLMLSQLIIICLAASLCCAPGILVHPCAR